MLAIGKTADGILVHIRELAAIAKSARPEVHCFDCERPFVPKLGRRRVHHFAHAPDSECAGSGGEGQHHQQAKLHLAHELRRLADRAGTLLGEVSCVACGARMRVELLRLEHGDEVHVEKGRNDLLRPDITIVRAGVDLASFEVVVTNPCSDEKWRGLDDTMTRVAEVLAAFILPVEPDGAAWEITVPLRTERQLHLSTSLCAQCARKPEAAPEAPVTEPAPTIRTTPPVEPETSGASARSRAPLSASLSQYLFPAGQLIPGPRTPPAHGYCIRCGEQRPFDPDRPHCKRCFESWREWNRPDYIERCCHLCGKAARVTKMNSLCESCSAPARRLRIRLPPGSVPLSPMWPAGWARAVQPLPLAPSRPRPRSGPRGRQLGRADRHRK